MRNPVASVNEQLITRFELETAIQEYALQLHEQMMDQLAGTKLAELKRVALEKLIVWRLISQGAEEHGIVITDKEVADETAKLIDKFSSKEEFFDKLANRGVDVELLRDSVRRELTVMKISDRMIREAAEPAAAEIDEEYQKYLDEKKDEAPLALADASPKIESFLRERAGIARLRGWVAQLRARATIEIIAADSANQNLVAL